MNSKWQIVAFAPEEIPIREDGLSATLVIEVLMQKKKHPSSGSRIE